ncbi:hypothetical protein EDD16DRAFT_1623916, partial [Pisolithus croceorrhizus]
TVLCSVRSAAPIIVSSLTLVFLRSATISLWCSTYGWSLTPRNIYFTVVVHTRIVVQRPCILYQRCHLHVRRVCFFLSQVGVAWSTKSAASSSTSTTHR